MFEGKGGALTENGLLKARRALGIDLPTLWAVMTVETRGCGFLPGRRPVILHERHIFHQRVDGRFNVRAPTSATRGQEAMARKVKTGTHGWHAPWRSTAAPHTKVR